MNEKMREHKSIKSSRATEGCQEAYDVRLVKRAEVEHSSGGLVRQLALPLVCEPIGNIGGSGLRPLVPFPSAPLRTIRDARMQKEEDEERESGQAPRHHRRRRAALFLCSQCGVGALSRRPLAQARRTPRPTQKI